MVLLKLYSANYQGDYANLYECFTIKPKLIKIYFKTQFPQKGSNKIQGFYKTNKIQGFYKTTGLISLLFLHLRCVQ